MAADEEVKSEPDFGVKVDPDYLMQIYWEWAFSEKYPREGGSADQDEDEMESIALLDRMVMFHMQQLRKRDPQTLPGFADL